VQRRLLVSTLAVAVAAVLLLGVPLAFVGGGLRSKDATAQLKHDATTLAIGLQERFDDGLPPDASGFARLLPGRYVSRSFSAAVLYCRGGMRRSCRRCDICRPELRTTSRRSGTGWISLRCHAWIPRSCIISRIPA
jgi:hypothetical protein